MKPPSRQGSPDDFQTPVEAIVPLLQYIPKDYLIWECSCGKGNLVKGFTEKGYNVTGTDILSNKDFLTWKPDKFDCIITNPPFCYDKNTEVLTDSSWKLLSKVIKSDKILSLNPFTLNIEWDQINDIFQSFYNGRMIHFKQKTVDILVTPNHRMYTVYNDNSLATKSRIYGKERNKNSKDLIEASDIKKTHHLKQGGFKWKGKEKKYFILPAKRLMYNKQKRFFPKIKISMDDWLPFLGIWLAEGSVRGSKKLLGEPIKGKQKNSYEIGIKQKDPNYKIIKQVLKKLPFKIREEVNGKIHNFTICDVRIWNFFYKLGNSYTKFIPSIFKDLSVRQLKILLGWYLFGDGTRIKNTQKIEDYLSFFTASETLKNDLIELFVKVGIFVNSKYVKNRCRGGFSCKILQNRLARLGGKFKHNINYKDHIYCLSLKKNTIFLTRRNGKLAFCGNSIKQEFLERCYYLGKPFALLLPLTTFESKKRQRLLERYYNETQYIFFDKRVNFETPSGKGSGSWFASMWVCYKINLPQVLNWYKTNETQTLF